VHTVTLPSGKRENNAQPTWTQQQERRCRRRIIIEPNRPASAASGVSEKQAAAENSRSLITGP